jgi:hypothetical protein
MFRLLRPLGRGAFVLGTTGTFKGIELPKFVKVHGVWPRLRVIFQYERETISNSVSYRSSNKQFTFSVPAKALDLPPEITRDDNEGAYTRLSDLEFLLDFTNLNSMAARQYAKRRADMLQEAMALLHAFGNLRVAFERDFDASLDREIGVRIEWDSDESVAIKPHSWHHHILLLIGIHFGTGRFTLADFYQRCFHQLKTLHTDDQADMTLQELVESGLIEKSADRYHRTQVQYTLES